MNNSLLFVCLFPLRYEIVARDSTIGTLSVTGLVQQPLKLNISRKCWDQKLGTKDSWVRWRWLLDGLHSSVLCVCWCQLTETEGDTHTVPHHVPAVKITPYVPIPDPYRGASHQMSFHYHLWSPALMKSRKRVLFTHQLSICCKTHYHHHIKMPCIYNALE